MVNEVHGSRRERKKADARRRILDAAVRLFGERGIEAVTVDEIAAAADVAKGSIYSHHRTKEDIVVAFLLDLEARVQQKAARITDDSLPAAEVLSRFIATQFRLKAPHHKFVRVFLGEMMTRTADFLPALVAMQQVTDPPLVKLFENLRDRGAIRGDVPLDQLLLVFKSMHLGLTAMWAVEGPPFRTTYRTLAAEMRVFCEGLAPERKRR